MKKILVVNNNLDTGGIQKSLVNLLQGIHGQYDVTLLLFSKSGALLRDVPEDVKIITPRSCYRMLGLTKSELKAYPALFLLKAFLMKYAKLVSRRSAMRLLGLFQKRISGYDAVISYTHFSDHTYFWNGSGDFVLDKTNSPNKICLIHCDYLNSGCMTEVNNRAYEEFDRIACCSDSVRDRFIQGTGMDPNKVYTLRNFYDPNIGERAQESPFCYDDHYVNLVSVARLSGEKGIDRAIEALHNSGRRDIRYYVIGDGPKREILKDMVETYHLEEQVFFLGEQQNPYRYMLHADYLLVPSRHEAAPMVFDEASVLGLRIVSTNTTSAAEMVGGDGGIVCENSPEGITEALVSLHKDSGKKRAAKSNQLQREQFAGLIG